MCDLSTLRLKLTCLAVDAACDSPRTAAHPHAEAGDGGEGVAVVTDAARAEVRAAAVVVAATAAMARGEVARVVVMVAVAVGAVVCQRRNSSCQHRRRRHP